jgi:hypothetical protein
MPGSIQCSVQPTFRLAVIQRPERNQHPILGESPPQIDNTQPPFVEQIARMREVPRPRPDRVADVRPASPHPGD